MSLNKKLRNGLLLAGAIIGLTSFKSLDELETRNIELEKTVLDNEYKKLVYSHKLEQLRKKGINEVVFDDNTLLEKSLKTDVDRRIRNWLSTGDINTIINQVEEITAYDDIISKEALDYSIPKTRLYSLIRTESSGKRTALSSQGAAGFTQLMPEIAKAFNIPRNEYVDYRYHPEENIDAGTSHLKTYYDMFNNNWVLAYISYNSGSGTSRRLKGKNWNQMKDFLLRTGRRETYDFVVRNLALNQILLNPARYDIEISKKPLLSETIMEHVIQPGETISDIQERYGTTYDELKEYNYRTHKTFTNKNIGLKDGYTLLIPRKL